MSEQMYYNDGLVSIGAWRCVFGARTVGVHDVVMVEVDVTPGPSITPLKRLIVVAVGSLCIQSVLAATALTSCLLCMLYQPGGVEQVALFFVVWLGAPLAMLACVISGVALYQRMTWRGVHPYELTTLHLCVSQWRPMYVASLSRARVGGMRAALDAAKAGDVSLAVTPVDDGRSSVYVGESGAWFEGRPYAYDGLQRVDLRPQSLRKGWEASVTAYACFVAGPMLVQISLRLLPVGSLPWAWRWVVIIVSTLALVLALGGSAALAWMSTKYRVWILRLHYGDRTEVVYADQSQAYVESIAATRTAAAKVSRPPSQRLGGPGATAHGAGPSFPPSVPEGSG